MSTKYLVNFTIKVISINRSQVLELETFIKNKMDKVLKNMNIDLVQPTIVKETDCNIKNDRLVITSIVNTSESLSEKNQESLSSTLTQFVKEYLDNQGIIFVLNLVTINKL